MSMFCIRSWFYLISSSFDTDVQVMAVGAAAAATGGAPPEV